MRGSDGWIQAAATWAKNPTTT